MDLQKRVDFWNDNITSDERKILNSYQKYEIENGFLKELEFGTAGVRAVMGIGPSYLNKYTIIRLTIAFFNYLKKNVLSQKFYEKGIVIFHDNRNNSAYFASLVADIFSSFKVKVYLTKNNELMPTPLLSFAVRELNAIAGIVITASHNPKEYNGFKIYNSFGAQLLPKETKLIQKEMEKITDEFIFDFSFSKKSDFINEIDEEIILNYKNLVKNLALNSHLKKEIKLTFSAQHGTSYYLMPKILKELGYEVDLVKEQCVVDGNFTHTKCANPEDKSAFELSFQYAKKNDSDIIIMTDPDADRLGVAVKNSEKDKYEILSGNTVASIMIYYLTTELKKQEKLPLNSVMYTTFVSGSLPSKIAEKHNVKTILTPTGFKWMAKEIIENPKYKMVFAFEQAIGYLVSDFVLDKDSFQAAVLLVDLANYYKVKYNLSLLEVYENIQKEYGYYIENDFSIVVKGLKGMEIFGKIMEIFRTRRIKNINNVFVLQKQDYLITFPKNDYKCNLIKYTVEDGWFAIRPSGTEPKIKIYLSISSKNKEKCEEVYNKLKFGLNSFIKLKIEEFS
ncbi:phospho-sugar mutase [symbiont of Argiope bruennichi]|uniref:phospho-sugar mutase n=1 Tax=symbiont of Argiope bruennichi TaxID=2810479 RepID=UPI003DA4EF21